MGNFAEDKEECLRKLRKNFADKQYLDFAETVVQAAPDVTVAYLIGPAVVVASTAAGTVVGAGVGTVVGGPEGMVVGGGAGAVGGLYWGVQLAEKASESYCSASTEDRARMRDLGGKVAKGGGAAYTTWKIGRVFFKFVA